jgi:DNA-binding transcriptional ArsR family regulator
LAYRNNVLEMSSSAGVPAPRWELYRVLSEPIRLRLLALTADEELAVGELAELLGESQPNISRHAAALKQSGLLAVRRQGTRTLLQLRDDAEADPVVADALASGRALCDADGSRARVADLVRTRDALGREFFARPVESSVARPAPELGAYVRMLAPLLPRRARESVALDAGTGDGGLLDVLSPAYTRVVAVDRSEAQLTRARERVALRLFDNVVFALGELDGPEVRAALVAEAGEGADAVFAARLLHHAPKPALVVSQLADLCRVGGTVVILDYLHHDDEAMRDQADLWLGFRGAELKTFARQAGLEDARVETIPAMLNGKGPDAHLTWQLLVGTKRGAREIKTSRDNGNTGTKRTAAKGDPDGRGPRSADLQVGTKRRKAVGHG